MNDGVPAEPEETNEMRSTSHSELSGRSVPSVLVARNTLHSMPGYRAMAYIDMLRRISHIFQGNVMDFQSHLARVQDPAYALRLLDENNLQGYDDYLSEAERLLHNVAAATQSRIDLLRVFLRKYRGSTESFLGGAYQRRVNDEFASDGEHQFFKGLRNYFLHYILPVAHGNTTIGPSEPWTFSLILDVASLLRWDGWDPAAQCWLKTQHPGMDVGAAIDHYALRVGSFDQWIENEIRKQYSSAIGEFNAAKEEFHRVYPLGI